MPDPVNTTIDNASITLKDEQWRDETLNFAGADDLLAGTILARDSVSLKLRLFVKGGVTNTNGVPKFVLTYPVSVAGAADVAVRVLSAGLVNKDRLVIDADASAANIDGAVIDQLRAVGILPISVEQLTV